MGSAYLGGENLVKPINESILNVYHYMRTWHPQPHQAKQNAIDLINVEHAVTLTERQAKANEWHTQNKLALDEYFLTHGVDINIKAVINE